MRYSTERVVGLNVNEKFECLCLCTIYQVYALSEACSVGAALSEDKRNSGTEHRTSRQTSGSCEGYYGKDETNCKLKLFCRSK